MTGKNRRRLWKSVLRQTANDPIWLGHWLRRHRRSEKLPPSRLAERLGLPLEGLIVLSLCRTPRDDHFHEDLDVVCRRTGANEAELARLLRQEQGLARWEKHPPPAQGWLMAASDAPPEPPSAEDQPPEGAASHDD
jgi:hypothetical protein